MPGRHQARFVDQDQGGFIDALILGDQEGGERRGRESLCLQAFDLIGVRRQNHDPVSVALGNARGGFDQMRFTDARGPLDAGDAILSGEHHARRFALPAIEVGARDRVVGATEVHHRFQALAALAFRPQDRLLCAPSRCGRIAWLGLYQPAVTDRLPDGIRSRVDRHALLELQFVLQKCARFPRRSLAVVRQAIERGLSDQVPGRDPPHEFGAQLVVRRAAHRVLHRSRHQHAVEHHRLPLGQVRDGEIHRFASTAFVSRRPTGLALATAVVDSGCAALLFPMRHKEPPFLRCQAILLRAGRQGNHLLLERGGLTARFPMVAQRVFDHLAALAECLDLRAVDVRQLEAPVLVREPDLIPKQLQLAGETGAVRGADQLGMLEQFFIGEGPPLPVAALRHVHDDHVRMQLRVLGAREFVLEGRGYQIAGPLAMAPAPYLLARIDVSFHQCDRGAHRLVVRFDNGLIAAD